MVVLGIDPGTHHLGWGVIRGQGNRIHHIGHGVLHARREAALCQRLHQLSQGLREVLDRFQPEVGAVETLFFHKDPQAAAKLGHIRGVVLLHLQEQAVEVAEYAPAHVKNLVTGSGRAEKSQVARMVKNLLCLPELPASDAADALALAVTHLRRAPIDQRLQEQMRANPALARLAALQKRTGSRRTKVPARNPGKRPS